MNQELKEILVKFAGSGWDVIDAVSQKYLDGSVSKEELIKAIKIADEQCGSCGCEYDPLYKRALILLAA